MFSLTKNPLSLFAIKGTEGIGITFLAKCTFGDLVNLVDIAPIDLAPEDKLQRDPTPARIKGISNYLISRKNTIFPEIILGITKANFESMAVDTKTGMEIGHIHLDADTPAILVDGQGRRLGIESAINTFPHLASNCIDLKIIVTETTSITEAKGLLRQVFSDLHKKIVKPSGSTNLYFDRAVNSSNFLASTLESLKSKNSEAITFFNLISIEGKNTHPYTLAQLSKFVQCFTGMSLSEQNKTFNDDAVFEFNQRIVRLYLNQILQTFPELTTLIGKKEVTQGRELSIIPTAIWLEALGYVGRSILYKSILYKKPVDFSVLNHISNFNFSRANPVLSGVVIHDNKIIKSSAKKLAMILIDHLGLPLDPKVKI
ncbi:DNA sulfur modification protein DndB [Aliivibrio fischeri]|uniref:DNA sulfur modification protein DndB n=1 Tax=Aliivibrio fischeri TaxID=668 RepID=UPI0012D92063|nr:DNA sulfur modification protein DndB [Aliivibrio fischeri]MUJ20355.1 DGQHR domain-containing protein [Aliivibrio fischeri]